MHRGITLSGLSQTEQMLNDLLSHSSNQTLVYFLTSRANTNQYLLDWPMITSKENTISFSLSGNNQPIKKVPLYVWIDPGQDVSPHTFTGELRVNIYKGTVSQGTFDKVGTGKISLSVKISEDIQVSLGNDQFSRLSEFKVKFEELKKGQVIVYDAYINSFDSYILKVKSKGKGHLTHHLDQVKTKIPYEISIDNQKVLFDEFGQSSQAVEKSGKAEKSHHKNQADIRRRDMRLKGNILTGFQYKHPQKTSASFRSVQVSLTAAIIVSFLFIGSIVFLRQYLDVKHQLEAQGIVLSSNLAYNAEPFIVDYNKDQLNVFLDAMLENPLVLFSGIINTRFSGPTIDVLKKQSTINLKFVTEVIRQPTYGKLQEALSIEINRNDSNIKDVIYCISPIMSDFKFPDDETTLYMINPNIKALLDTL